MKNKIVNKKWGYEIWFANVNEDKINYCGKELFVDYGIWSSDGAYHYHMIKDETFYIISGYLQLDYVDGSNFKTVILGPGESFRVFPYTSHRFTSASRGGCKFIEASTFHSDDDSYRCRWDIGKNEWVEV
jgi:mannose-6-phosphate isomerase-like protein (cupin superfamily)